MNNETNQNETEAKRETKKPCFVAKHGSVWISVYKYQYAFRNGVRTQYRFAYTENGQTKAATSSDFERIKLLAKERAMLIAQGRVSVASPTQELEIFQAARNILGEAYSLETVLAACRHYSATVLAVTTTKTLAEAIEEYLAARQNEVCANRLQRFRKVLNALTGGNDKMLAASLTSDALDLVVKESSSDEQTRYNTYSVLSTFIRWADKRGYLQDGMRLINRMTVKGSKQHGKREIFTAEELRKLMSVSSFELQTIFALCAFGGLRKSEALRLTWEQIDLEDNVIRLQGEQVKTGARRGVAILPTLAAWLNRVPVAERHGKVWKQTESLYFRMQPEASAKAGVEWKDNGLRHTAISARCCNGSTMADIAEWAGNSIKEIKGHYLNLMRKAEAQAWWQVLPA